MKSNTQQRRFIRFSLAALLLFVAVVSVCLAALRYATAGLASGAVSVTVGFIVLAFAMGAGSLGARRAFWITFAATGSLYLVVTMSFNQEFVQQLVTSKLVALVRDSFHPPSEFDRTGLPPRESAPGLLSTQSGGVPGIYVAKWLSDLGDDYAEMNTNFVLIGQCIWSLVLGTLVGVIAQFTARRVAHRSVN